MLGRTTYTRAELDHARSAIAEQVASYDRLARAVDDVGEPRAVSSLRSYEPHFFNDLLLVLDGFFAHRLRAVAGPDPNPLNEVGRLSDSLSNNGGVLREGDEAHAEATSSVLGAEVGSTIRLTADQFRRLSEAFFLDLEAKFL